MPNSMLPRMMSRRQTLRGLAVTCIVVAVPESRAWISETPGAGAPHLDVKDPSAVAVGYVEDAAKVDAKKYPTYSQGSSCANCLQLQGTDGASYRPCSLFPGKLVATAGWCSGWTAEI